MENIFIDQRKFETATLKNDAFLNFAVNQEKRINIILKNLGQFYRRYRLPHLAKFLVPILNPLIKNKYTVKNSFHFTEEICL